MRKVKLISSYLLLAISILLVLTACGTNNNEPANNNTTGNNSTNNVAMNETNDSVDKPYEGTSIRFIMAVHPWLDTIREMLPEFEAETGIEVNIESYSQEQTSSRMAIELAAGSSSLDVMFIRPLDETKMFTRNGWIEPIGPYVEGDEEYDLNDFIPAAIDSVTYEDELIGIPIMTEREILYYRKDLLEEHGIEVPTTLDELREAAAILHNPSEGMYGFAARGGNNVSVTQFSGFLYSFGGEFHEGDVATLNTPEAMQAYEYYGEMLREYGLPGVVNMHWPEITAAFAQGQLAMFIDADAIYSNVADEDKSMVSDQVGYAMFPEGPAGAKPYNVSSGGLALSKFSENKEAAAEFIKWATSKDVVLQTQIAGNPSARQSVWDNPESTEDYPEQLVEVINQSSEIGVGSDRPQVIGVGEARDIISAPITTAIEGGDIQAAADRAQRLFQELIDEENAE